MTSTEAAETAAPPTLDGFLGGRLHLWQPARGYRAGVDAVFLAAACPAVSGQTVLELGCGAGAAALCLAARVPDLSVVGLEREAEMAQFARCNAARTGLPLRVIQGDLSDMPKALKVRQFDHVIANPPYFQRQGAAISPTPLREAAMAEATPLTDWIDAAARRLRPKGWLTMILRTERVADLLHAVHGRLGSIDLQPLAPRQGRPAHLVLMRARKAGRAPLRLCAPVILHHSARHISDAEDYAPPIASVLRHGSAFPGFGD